LIFAAQYDDHPGRVKYPTKLPNPEGIFSLHSRVQIDLGQFNIPGRIAGSTLAKENVIIDNIFRRIGTFSSRMLLSSPFRVERELYAPPSSINQGNTTGVFRVLQVLHI